MATASSNPLHDLESGPNTITRTCDMVQVPTEASHSPTQSSQDSALSSNTPRARSQFQTLDKAVDEDMFVGDAGQALLLAFKTGKDDEAAAILVPVARPSIEWARNMEVLEEKHERLPVDAPEETQWEIQRWEEFRWLHCGEDEVEIWKRIRRHYIAQRPKWHVILPFWRSVLVEERHILLHSREGARFRVEIEPALDSEEEQKKADSRFDQACHVLEEFSPGDYCCQGDFNAFGGWFSKYHDIPCCRKGTLIDEYNEYRCDIEVFMECKSKRDRMKRQHDFIDCFKDPPKASTVFPLTTGRILSSCIYDNRSICSHELPNRRHPNRLPPRINGLVIEYQFRSTRLELEIIVSSLFVLIIVLLWKLATGDWNVAAAFGSLCVALMTLAHQRSYMSAGKEAKVIKVA